jgi:hypothetical protein
MRLRSLHKGAWTVLAPEDDDRACEVLDQLEALAGDKKTKATAAGFLAQWEQVPVEGPRRLGTDIYHRIDEDNQIYEFIKRDHRLVCFEADGRIVVCSHIFRKKSQKPRIFEKSTTKLRVWGTLRLLMTKAMKTTLLNEEEVVV